MSPESVLAHHFIASMTVCVSAALLALFVFLKGPNKRINITYALNTAAISVWSGVGGLAMITPDPERAALLFQINHMGVIWIPAFFTHFVESLSAGAGQPLRRMPVLVAYGYAVVFSIINLSGSLITDVAPRMHCKNLFGTNASYLWLTILWLALIFYALYRLVATYFKSDAKNKNRMTYFCLTTLLAYVGGSVNFLTAFGVELPVYIMPFGMYLIPVYILVTIYAILSKNLMDIRVVIKRTLMYTSLASLISIVYVVLIFAIYQVFLGHGADGQSWRAFLMVPRLGLEAFNSKSDLLLNHTFVAYLVTAATSVPMAAFVYFKGRDKTINQTYALYVLSIGIWSGFDGFGLVARDAVASELLWKIGHVGVSFIPSFFVHFVLSLMSSSGRTPARKGILILAYAYSAVFSVVDLAGGLITIKPKYFYNFFVDATPVYAAYTVLWTIFIGYGLYQLVYLCLKSDKAQRNQLSYFCVSMLLAYVGGGANYLPIFNMQVPYLNPFGNYLIPIHLLVTTHAIIAHRLMDIEIVLKKTFYYFILAFIVSLVYVGLIFITHHAYLNAAKPGLLINIAAIVIIASLMKPIEIVMHRILDKRFFRGSISQISEEKERLRVELERRERLKSVGILAAGMAHEIKNPLTAINTFVEYLPQKFDDPQFREDFQRIVRSEIVKMKDIIQDLLDFSKPREPVRQSCDLNHLVRDTLSLLSKEFVASGVTVDYDGQSEVQTAMLDPGQIKQALVNVIMNAVEAMRGKPGILRIRVGPGQDGRIIVSIQDNGRGIPPDKIQRIFDPFFTETDNGTGLGLAITHSIIDQHRGRITVESTLGVGTIVAIYLPIES